MHERTKYKHKHIDVRKAIWKLVDDYSGAYIYSNEMEIDYRGLVTKAGHADPIPPEMFPTPIPRDDGESFERDS